ncbi:hypothetical protein [Methylorubrum rhodinum]|uniref:hypothetical protein n=1 Tax=Methylorubrum rhodinum TaxID=29428 RepID=UPI003BB1B3F4
MGRPRQPRPWHDEAKRLFDLGVPIARIAREIGVPFGRVYFDLKPAQALQANARKTERDRRRRRTDPEFVARERATKKKSRIRAAARQEAAETGAPVEQIYERWGVA